MTERIPREKIRKGIVMHGGPCPSDPIRPSTGILAEIEAIDADFEAAFKRDLAIKAELERVRLQESKRLRRRR